MATFNPHVYPSITQPSITDGQFSLSAPVFTVTVDGHQHDRAPPHILTQLLEAAKSAIIGSLDQPPLELPRHFWAAQLIHYGIPHAVGIDTVRARRLMQAALQKTSGSGENGEQGELKPPQHIIDAQKRLYKIWEEQIGMNDESVVVIERKDVGGKSATDAQEIGTAKSSEVACTRSISILLDKVGIPARGGSDVIAGNTPGLIRDTEQSMNTGGGEAGDVPAAAGARELQEIISNEDSGNHLVGQEAPPRFLLANPRPFATSYVPSFKEGQRSKRAAASPPIDNATKKTREEATTTPSLSVAEVATTPSDRKPHIRDPSVGVSACQLDDNLEEDSDTSEESFLESELTGPPPRMPWFIPGSVTAADKLERKDGGIRYKPSQGIEGVYSIDCPYLTERLPSEKTIRRSLVWDIQISGTTGHVWIRFNTHDCDGIMRSLERTDEYPGEWRSAFSFEWRGISNGETLCDEDNTCTIQRADRRGITGEITGEGWGGEPRHFTATKVMDLDKGFENENDLLEANNLKPWEWLYALCNANNAGQNRIGVEEWNGKGIKESNGSDTEDEYEDAYTIDGSKMVVDNRELNRQKFAPWNNRRPFPAKCMRIG